MDPRFAPALAADLRTAGYDADALAELWGSTAAAALRRGDAVPARRMLASAGDTAIAVLARLLYFGDRMPRDAVATALPTLGLTDALASGLVAESDAGTVRAAVVLRPTTLGPEAVRGWIASDLDELAGQSPLRPDHVLGVGGAGRTLISLLPPAGTGAALDLGCGCGIIAIELRLRGYEVVATDVSERALEMTRLNVALNGLDGIQTRRGSLYEPVEGERFSMVASNPPFVITPRRDDVATYEYRDGGRTGDALMAAVLAGLGAHLTPDGQARLLGNWEDTAGRSGLDRLASWAPDVAVWAIERERLDPAAYAQLWVRDGGTLPGTAEYERMLTAWLDDFAARGVVSVGMGWVIARAGAGAVRAERLTQPVDTAGLGAHVAAALAAEARLEQLDDVALAASVPLVARDVTEARHHMPGSEAPVVIELRQGGGLARTIEVDPALAALVGASDGDLPIGALADAIAQLLEVEPRALRTELFPRVRELVVAGLLTLA